MFWRSTSLCLLVTLLVPAYRVSQAQEREATELAAVQYWQQQLQAPSPTMRAHAAAALARFGKASATAIDDLYRVLADNDPQVRMQSAQAIGYLLVQPSASVEHLVPLLDDSDEHVRYAAEWALARLALLPVSRGEAPRRLQEFQTAVAKLEQRKHHVRHRLVIEQAIRSVEELLSTPPEPVIARQEPAEYDPANLRVGQLQRMVSQFYLDSLMQRLQAIEQLSKSDAEPAVDEQRRLVQRQLLEQAYERSDRSLIRFAGRQWGPEADEARSKILTNSLQREPLANWLSEVILDCKSIDRNQCGQLIGLASDRNRPTALRHSAVVALGRCEVLAAADLQALTALATQATLDDRLRYAAIEALGNQAQGESANFVVDQLFRLSMDPTAAWKLRLRTANAVVRIEPSRATDVIDQLVGSLGEQRDEQRLGLLLDCLVDFPTLPFQAVEPIRSGLNSPLAKNRATAIRCIVQISGSSDELLGLLLDRFSDPAETHSVLVAAVESLARLGPQATQAFSKRLSQVHPFCRTQALWAIGEVGIEFPGLPAICELACNGPQASTASKCAAALALGNMRSATHVDLDCLYTAIAEGNAPSVRTAALIALARLRKIELTDVQRFQASADDALSRVSAVYARYLLGDPHALHAMVSMLSLRNEVTSSNSQAEQLSLDEWVHGALVEIGPQAIRPLWDVATEPSIPTEMRAEAVIQLASIPQANHNYLLDLVDDPRLGGICIQQILRVATEPSGQIGESAIDRLVTKHRQSQDAAERYRLEQLTEQLYETISPASARMHLESQVSSSPFKKRRSSWAQSQSSTAAPLAVPSITENVAMVEPARGLEESSGFTSLMRNQTNTNRFLRRASEDLLDAETVEMLPTAALGLPGSLTGLDLQPGFDASPSAPQELPRMASKSMPADLSPSMFQLAPLQETNLAADGQDQTQVTVYYGTNRKTSSVDSLAEAPSAAWPGGTRIWIAALFLVGIYWLSFHFRRTILVPSAVAIGATVLLLTLQLAEQERDQSLASGRAVTYGEEYGDDLALGVCEVSIPALHRKGQLESPSLFRMELKPDEDKHIVLQSTTELGAKEFFDNLDGEMQSKGHNLLVFIHGYNVAFEDAARRAAQLTHDLDFPGAPVFYSWPSNGSWYQYQNDRENIQRSVRLIKKFLLELAERSQAESIHLVAHSMGNVGLTQALAEIAPQPEPTFNHVILAAPDIDADVFHREIAPKIAGKAKRYTMYISNSDLALMASRYFNAGRRIGETPPSQHFDHIDVVDASGVDTSLLGHSYYGGLSVLNDLSEVLADRPLNERTFLKTETVGGIARAVFNLPKFATAADEDRALDR